MASTAKLHLNSPLSQGYSQGQDSVCVWQKWLSGHVAQEVGSGMGKEGGKVWADSRLQSKRVPGYQASWLPDLWDSVQNENVGPLVQIIKNFKTTWQSIKPSTGPV